MKNTFGRLCLVGVMVLLITLLTGGIVYASGSSAEGHNECSNMAGNCCGG